MKKILFILIISLLSINVYAEDEIIIIEEDPTTTSSTTTQVVTSSTTTNSTTTANDSIIIESTTTTTEGISITTEITSEEIETEATNKMTQETKNKIYLIALAILGIVILLGLFIFFIKAIRASNLM